MQVATWLAAEWRTGTGEGAQTLGADSAERGCGRNVSAFGPAAHHSHFRAVKTWRLPHFKQTLQFALT